MSISNDDIVAGNETFQAYMRRLDAILKSEGVDVWDRPLAALVHLARDGVEIAAYSIYDNNVSYINDWFFKRYGDRLKTHFVVGRYVSIIDNEKYVVFIPRFPENRQYYVHNLIHNMTIDYWTGLGERVWKGQEELFQKFHELFWDIKESRHLDLLDVNASIEFIMAYAPSYGNSKWSSLMFAEKALKTFIRLHDTQPKQTHKLANLADTAKGLGLKADLSNLILQIQCDAGVRYGDIQVTMEEAVAAHQASIELAAVVSREMPRKPK